MGFSFEKLLSHEATLTHMMRNVLRHKNRFENDESCPISLPM